MECYSSLLYLHTIPILSFHGLNNIPIAPFFFFWFRSEKPKESWLAWIGDVTGCDGICDIFFLVKSHHITQDPRVSPFYFHLCIEVVDFVPDQHSLSM